MNGMHRLRARALIGLLAALAAAPGFAQMAEDKTTVIGVDLLNPFVGRFSASFEQVLDGDLTLFAIPTYYNVKAAIFSGLPAASEIKPDHFHVWSVTVAAGANYYVNGVAPTGVFVGAWLAPGYGYARYVESAVKVEGGKSIEGTGTVLIGAGAHVGYRVIWGPVALTPRIGVSYQIAFASFDGYRGHNERNPGDNTLRPIMENVVSGLRFPWSIELAIAF